MTEFDSRYSALANKNPTMKKARVMYAEGKKRIAEKYGKAECKDRKK